MKILSFDIETSPIEAYTWGPKWETSLIEVTEQMRVLSYSAKWLKGRHITKGWPDYKGYKNGVLEDKAIIKDIWDLMNEADVVVGQNIKSFDNKIINARFVYHGLPPPSPYKLIDTKTEVKKYLRMPSNSLDDLSAYYGLGRKQEHEGFPLWKKCMAGDRKAWKKMLKYNKHDVVLTEKLYLLLRPWIQNHPSYGTYTDSIACPNCGSTKPIKWGYYYTNAGKFQRYKCPCGKQMRGGSNLNTTRQMLSI